MEQQNAMDILKNAILMEKRGKAFYQKVAQEAKTGAVKDFFQMMAHEEENHMTVLGEQFRAYKNNKRFLPATPDYHSTSDIASKILTKDIVDKVESAGFESAAISGAIALEERANSLYEHRAGIATDPDEIALYQWLAQWEREHLDALIKMDRMLTEKIWNDNHFWPF